jgi:hypothetical protein
MSAPNNVIPIAYPHGPYFRRKGVDLEKKFLNASFQAKEMTRVIAATNRVVSLPS